MPLYFFYTMVQKSRNWPKTQIKGGGGPAITSQNLRCILLYIKHILNSIFQLYIIIYYIFQSFRWASVQAKLHPDRGPGMSVNTKMEHRTLAWVLVITPTRVHLSESISRKDSKRKMFKVEATFLPSVEVENNFWNFLWRPSLYPFPNPIFTVLKILYLNCNHRR